MKLKATVPNYLEDEYTNLDSGTLSTLVTRSKDDISSLLEVTSSRHIRLADKYISFLALAWLAR